MLYLLDIYIYILGTMFPRIPFHVGMAWKEIRVWSGRFKWSSSNEALRSVQGWVLTSSCTWSLICWAPLVSSRSMAPAALTKSLPLASQCPEPGTFADSRWRAPAPSASHYVIKGRGRERQMWFQFVLTVPCFLLNSFSDFLISLTLAVVDEEAASLP